VFRCSPKKCTYSPPASLSDCLRHFALKMRSVDAGCRARKVSDRIGLSTRLPWQLGQFSPGNISTQTMQNVHSKLHMGLQLTMVANHGHSTHNWVEVQASQALTIPGRILPKALPSPRHCRVDGRRYGPGRLLHLRFFCFQAHHFAASGAGPSCEGNSGKTSSANSCIISASGRCENWMPRAAWFTPA